MICARMLTIVLACTGAGVSAQPPAAAPADLTKAERTLAAESLARSAGGILLTPDAPARVRRLIVLAELARRLAPDNYHANRLLADVYQGQDDFAQAVGALDVCLKTADNDQAIWRQWLVNKTATLQSSEDRREFFDRVIKDQAIPSAVRAQAMVRYAEILVGQGLTDEARRLFLQTLAFDPYHRGGLTGWLSLQKEAISPVDQCNMLLRILRGSPMDLNAASDVAVLLGSMGLWKDAIAVFDYAWEVGRRDMGPEAFPHVWLMRYCNAMLDARQAERAVKMFSPMRGRFPDSLDLQILLMEAYGQLNKPGEVRDLIRQIEAAYQGTPTGPDALQYNIEMAMFYLTARPDATRALRHARQAVQLAGPDAGESVLLMRLLGAAEVASGAIAAGVKRLATISSEDAYAAYFLAEYYFGAAQDQPATEALGAGVALGRSGPAYRLLAMVARKHRIPIEPAPGTGQIKALMTKFGTLTFQMGRQPERFVQASLTAAPTVAVGDPITITARLTNIGPVDIPIGQTGVCSPVMALRVAVAEDPEATFVLLPMAVWHAPRYLGPGRTLSCETRLDVGPLRDYLSARPMSKLTLVVTGILDPVQRGEELVSALPSVQVASATIVRTSLLTDLAKGGGYDPLDALLRKGLDSDDPSDRMRTAGRIGSLLALLAEVDAKRASLPEQIPPERMRSDLLAMTRRLLQDRSAVVRAEMLNALRQAERADRLQLMGLVLDDVSPLVRVREAELLGLSAEGAVFLGRSSKEAEDPRLRQLANDEDALVAKMASAFIKPAHTQPADAAADDGGQEDRGE
ncbi:hypothetical protein LCGC14_0205350 [marine sediment metagenome]|uniref:Tetratricopeptide repeat protein n=1 Tax=marine sediment metagenome TaxID=412755 RepID=A0A0F9UZ57_9ZZZZ|nr:hypothetical protein [Phycisphaerae bacterium]HDZ44741.1 hypothetical protein [Phycisphaerae bacterium]